jgi:hypothetical protein
MPIQQLNAWTLRWHQADALEGYLNERFSNIYCNVQPSDHVDEPARVIVRVARRWGFGQTGPYILELEELVEGFPTELLIARLWLVEPRTTLDTPT